MPAPSLARVSSRIALAVVTLAAPMGAQTTHFGAGARDAFLAAATTPVANGIDGAGPTYGFGALGTGTVTGNGIASTMGNIFASGGGIAVPAFTIDFSSALGAFGADFSGLGTINADFPFPAGVAEFRFLNGASVVGTVTQHFGATGATTFFGVTGLAAFDRVQVRTNVGDEFLTDNVVVGAALVAAPPATTVPEPTTVVLLGAGLVGVVGVARRRASATA